MTREQAERLRVTVAEQMTAHNLVSTDPPSSSLRGFVVASEASIRAMAINVAMSAMELGTSSHPICGEPGVEIAAALTDLSAAAALLAADNPDFAPASIAIDELGRVLDAMRNSSVL